MTECESNACIVVDLYSGEENSLSVLRVRSTVTGTVMQAGQEEFSDFLKAVKEGKFDEYIVAE